MEETGRYGGIEKVEICLGSGCGVGVRVVVRVRNEMCEERSGERGESGF